MSTEIIFNNARSKFATGSYNWPTMSVSAMLLNANYLPLISHVHVADIPAPAIVIRDIALTGLSQLDGRCRGVIPQFGAFSSAGVSVAAIVLYTNTGSDATAELIYFSNGGNGFPFVAVGINYNITYDFANGGFFQV